MYKEIKEVTVLDTKKGLDGIMVERKKINIICPEPFDQFAETHKEFTKEQRKQAKLNYKNQIKC